jgi:hypothetical protein
VSALLASEVRRLWSRRIVRVALLAGVVLVLVLDLLVALFRNPDRLHESMRTIEIWVTPGMARELGVQRGDSVLPTVAVLTYLIVVVIGASAIGAEYRAGTVTTVLTWSPRRVRLIIARYLAIAIVGMAFFLAVQLVFVAGWTLGSALQGSTAGADADFWREVASVLLRTTLIAGGLAVVSGALATVCRNTAGAMGIWFGYLIVVEGDRADELRRPGAVVPHRQRGRGVRLGDDPAERPRDRAGGGPAPAPPLPGADRGRRGRRLPLARRHLRPASTLGRRTGQNHPSSPSGAAPFGAPRPLGDR